MKLACMAHTHRRFLVVVVIWNQNVVDCVSGARNSGKDHERQTGTRV